MFIYNHPQYPRSTSERLFKQAFNTAWVLNFSAFVIAFTDVQSRIDSTFSNYWGGNEMHLNQQLKEVLNGCQRVENLSVGQLSAPTLMSVETLPLPFMQLTQVIVAIFIMHALMTFFAFFTIYFYARNIRHFRFRGVQVRISQWFVLIVTLLCVGIITAVATVNSLRWFIVDYVEYCKTQYIENSRSDFITQEFDVNIVFGANLNLLIVSCSIQLFVYFIGIIFLIKDGLRESNARLAKMKHPWEKGYLCRPKKPVLAEYVKSRKARENEAMMTSVGGMQMNSTEGGVAAPYDTMTAVRFSDQFQAGGPQMMPPPQEIVEEVDVLNEEPEELVFEDDVPGSDALEEDAAEVKQRHRHRRRVRKHVSRDDPEHYRHRRHHNDSPQVVAAESRSNSREGGDLNSSPYKINMPPS